MSIPLSTTTIDIFRPDTSADDYESDRGVTLMFPDVRAQLSSPKGRGRQVEGQIEVVDKELECDPIDLKHTDIIRDNGTGDWYSIVWMDQRIGLGLDHTTGGLKRTTGVAP